MRPGSIEIAVEGRSTGRHSSRVLRKNQKIPGVIYGAGVKGNHHFSADEKMVVKYGSHLFENTILTLKSQDSKLNDVKVLLKEIIRHPVTRKPLHIDFWAIDLKKTVRVPVEVKFEGRAIGLAEGGVLQPLLREVEVECLPTEIPESLTVDVSNLGIHDTLHVSDIKFPTGVKAVTPENLAIVTVTIVREEEAAPVAAAAAAAPGAAAEPEVIGKGKKPEEGAAAAGGDAKAGAAKPAAAPAKK